MTFWVVWLRATGTEKHMSGLEQISLGSTGYFLTTSPKGKELWLTLVKYWFAGLIFMHVLYVQQLILVVSRSVSIMQLAWRTAAWENVSVHKFVLWISCLSVAQMERYMTMCVLWKLRHAVNRRRSPSPVKTVVVSLQMNSSQLFFRKNRIL